MTPASPRPQVDAAVERILCSDLPLLHLLPPSPLLIPKNDPVRFNKTALNNLSDKGHPGDVPGKECRVG